MLLVSLLLWERDGWRHLPEDGMGFGARAFGQPQEGHLQQAPAKEGTHGLSGEGELLELRQQMNLPEQHAMPCLFIFGFR